MPSPMLAETECIRRASEGDHAAFSRLVSAYQSTLRMQLRHLAHGEASLADDLAQEALILAWKYLPSFRREARFSTWLYRIAYHCFLMHTRKRVEVAHDSAHEPAEAPDRAVDTVDPAQRMDVERALARLPEHERVAIIHCYYLDLSHDEAAAVLDIPIGTLKSRVLRAKARLRERLSAWAPKEVLP